MNWDGAYALRRNQTFLRRSTSRQAMSIVQVTDGIKTFEIIYPSKNATTAATTSPGFSSCGKTRALAISTNPQKFLNCSIILCASSTGKTGSFTPHTNNTGCEISPCLTFIESTTFQSMPDK